MEANDEFMRREKLLRDSFTPAEWATFAAILATSTVAFWLADPRSFWLLGFFLIVGCFTPLILKLHENTHPFFTDYLWTKFGLLTLPGWIALLQHFVGLFRDPLDLITFEGASFLALHDYSEWLPVRVDASGNSLTVIGHIGGLLITTMLFLVPKSRAFFERILPWLCLLAVSTAVFGLLQYTLATDKALGTPGTGRSDFFGFFPYDGHWAAFAILWTCVCFAMSLLTTRYDDSPAFIESPGPLYLSGGLLLGGTGILVQARWPGALLIITTSVMLLFFAIHFLRIKNDPHRIPIASMTGLFAILAFAGGLIKFFRLNDATAERDELLQSAWHLFREQPVFGWGMDSFEKLLPFYGSDLLVGESYARAGSDLAQILAEFGIVGLLAFAALPIAMIIRYFTGRKDIQLTNHILIGIVVLLLLAVFDTPFMSPAVLFSFFALLFTALRWADLSRKPIDEVDAARPVLVAPASERNAPFHIGSQKQDANKSER